MSSEAFEDEGRSRNPRRKPYEKPVLEFVELGSDQVLSGNCKYTDVSGTGALPCATTGCSSNSPS